MLSLGLAVDWLAMTSGPTGREDPPRSTGVSLWALLRPHRWRLAAVLLIGAVAALGESLGLALFSVLLNHLLDAGAAMKGPALLHGFYEQARTRPHVFFALIALVYVAKSLLTLVSNYVSIAVALRIADRWRVELLRSVLSRASPGLQAKQGSLLQLVLDEPSVAGGGLSAAGILVQNAISAAVIYATLIWLSPSTTLALTAVAALAFAVLTLLFRYARRVAEQRSRAYEAGYGYITEMLSALRQVTLFGLESAVLRKADDLVGQMRHVHRRGSVIASSPRIVIEVVFVASLVLMLALFAPTGGQSAFISAAGLAALAAMRLVPSFSAAAGTWVQVQQALPAMARIEERLRALYTAQAQEAASQRPAPPLQRVLQLHNVHFSYPGRDAALRGIDLTVPAGSFVALVGPSGSGKSTLIDLLCGLFEPDRGEICLDGVDLRGLSRSSWRQQLGVVAQDAFLFSGTVRENLCLLRPDCPEATMREAVAVVGAEPIIAALPAGYDTVIGERGHSLSGGQRQRLAMARVLIRQPRLLLLDEATSALDSASDEMVFRGLERHRGDATLIAVAHRLSSIRRADCIYVLQNGLVVESGDHASLLRQGGLYAVLYRTTEDDTSARVAE
jgi:ATP-binding cassette, subfamily B, bacterial